MEGEQTNKRVIILGIVLFVLLMGVMYFMSLEQQESLERLGVEELEQPAPKQLTPTETRNWLTAEEHEEMRVVMTNLLEQQEIEFSDEQ
jgi:hypothetical protein